jgi:hypothetical protein
MSAKGKAIKIVGASNNTGNRAVDALAAMIAEVQQASDLHKSAIESRDLVAIDHAKIEQDFHAIKQQYEAVTAHLAAANADVKVSAANAANLRAQFASRALMVAGVYEPAAADAPEVSVKVLSMKTVYQAAAAPAVAADAAAPASVSDTHVPDFKFKTIMTSVRVNEHETKLRLRDFGVKNNLTPKIFACMATSCGDGIYIATINKVKCYAVVLGGICHLSRGPGKITMEPVLKRLFQYEFASDDCRNDPSAHGYYDADLNKPGLPRNSPTILGCYDTGSLRDLKMPNGAAYFSINDWQILSRGPEAGGNPKQFHEAVLRVDSAVATTMNFMWVAMLFQELVRKYQ